MAYVAISMELYIRASPAQCRNSPFHHRRRGNGIALTDDDKGGRFVRPEGYFETVRFEIPDKGLPSWSHPVISDGRLYVRNQDIVKVYDIKSSATP